MSELSSAAPQRSKRMRIVTIVFLSLIGLSLPACIWLFTQMHAASEGFNQFSVALVAKDYERAYGLTTTEFRAAMSEKDFEDRQEALCSHLGALKKVVAGPSETEGNLRGWSSTINAKFVFAEADRDFTFEMRKEGGAWMVYGFKEQ